MLSEKIQGAFNKQLNSELYSSYLYFSMAAYFESENLAGMANWMRIQTQEELQHATKFFDFILERNGKVALAGIEGPPTQWDSPLKAFEDAYAHECKVSGQINDLVDLALVEHDHAAGSFLQWFVTEQVEEEASTLAVVEQLRLMGDHGVAKYMIDQQLGQRTLGPTA